MFWTLFGATPGCVVLAGLALGGALSGGMALKAGLLIVAGSAYVAFVRWCRDRALLRRATANALAVGQATSQTSLGAAMSQIEGQLAASAQERGQIIRSYGAILDLIPDGLLLIDPSMSILMVNKGARALFGDELVGRALSAVTRNPQILEVAETVIAENRAQEVEYEMPVPVPRRIHCVAVPVPNPASSTVAGGLIFRDVTAMRQSEQMRADFVANASHEIRTPLTAVAGFIETLRGPAKGDPEAQERFLKIMAEQVERMSRLVADLLSLSRIELSEHTPPQDKVKLSPIIKRALKSLAWKAKEKGIQIEFDVPDSLPEIIGDANEIEQVFLNLIDNAIKYGKQKGRLRVLGCHETVPIKGAPWPKGTEVISVSIHDDGSGIPKDHLPRLTERFYRVDAARSRDAGGTGLGLAIVKHIVNRHKGWLRIESELGQGSTFTVHLPTTRGDH